MNRKAKANFKRHKAKPGPTSHAATTELVDEMLSAGADFYFRSSGSVVVRNLNSLPRVLVDRFLDSDAAVVVAAVRARHAQAARESRHPVDRPCDKDQKGTARSSASLSFGDVTLD